MKNIILGALATNLIYPIISTCIGACLGCYITIFYSRKQEMERMEKEFRNTFINEYEKHFYQVFRSSNILYANIKHTKKDVYTIGYIDILKNGNGNAVLYSYKRHILEFRKEFEYLLAKSEELNIFLESKKIKEYITGLKESEYKRIIHYLESIGENLFSLELAINALDNIPNEKMLENNDIVANYSKELLIFITDSFENLRMYIEELNNINDKIYYTFIGVYFKKSSI